MTYQPIKAAIQCIVFLAILWGCDAAQEDISGNPAFRLTYSLDTVKFDTLLTGRASVTKRFKVYNRNKRAVSLDEISLGTGDNSPYLLYVNGIEGKSFTDKVIYGRDSMLVLVEVDIDPQDEDTPYLIKDKVNFGYNGNLDTLGLVAWGQDAIYLDGKTLDCNTVWTKGKPYVLYDTIQVTEGCTLAVEAGARIFIDNNSALEINGTLSMTGSADDRIIVRNTRFDEDYLEQPGQWDAIFFSKTSTDNIIDHAIIRNGDVGLWMVDGDGGQNQLTINNTSIGNMSTAGILSNTAKLSMTNVEVFNCADDLLKVTGEGQATIDHCSFSNESYSFARSEPSLKFTNETNKAALTLSITHSIIWGDLREELLIESVQSAEIKNNIIRSNNKDWSASNLLSQEFNYPNFLTIDKVHELKLDNTSVAIDKALESMLATDITGASRDDKPDLGAHEFIPKE